MKTSLQKLIAAAFLAAATLLIPGRNASAAVVVNFQLIEPLFPAYSGTAAAPDTGTYWNTVTINSASTASISYTMPGSVFASDGATSSGITISSFTPSAGTGNVGVFTGGDSSFPLVRRDLLTTGDGQVSMVIGGLTANGEYDIYFYSQNAEFHSAVTDFTIGATTESVDNRLSTQPPFSFVEGETYALFSSVVANGSGEITVSYTSPDFESAFNAFQVVAVPEPGTALVFLFSATGLLLFRRGRRLH
ncbi:MAG: PEP-CTERM sorting domain-containing protein [Terrimicrobiaceae bacterium]